MGVPPQLYGTVPSSRVIGKSVSPPFLLVLTQAFSHLSNAWGSLSSFLDFSEEMALCIPSVCAQDEGSSVVSCVVLWIESSPL